MTTWEEYKKQRFGETSEIDRLASSCGNIINRMYTYYNTASLAYQPEIALFVALEAIGIICGRVWQTENLSYRVGETTHTLPGYTTTDYLIILAKTGSGKETAKKVLNTFLGNYGITIAPNVTGASALYSEVMWSPRLVLIQDEAGLRRQSAGSGAGDPYGPRTADTLLMDVYNNRDATVDPPLYAAGKDNPNYQPIHRQAMSCVLISTPETYEDALHSDDARSGYLGRHVILRSSRPRPLELGEMITEPAENLKEDERLAKLLKPFFGWRRYHAGAPWADTYNQLIRPYQTVAWDISGDKTAKQEALVARKARYQKKNKSKKETEEIPPPPIYDKTQPYEIVKWGEGAREALAEIYAENEQYISKRPEATDLLARKMQHVAQYAMRIALAKHGIGIPVTPQTDLQNVRVPTDTTPEKWEAFEVDFTGCESISDIRQHADEVLTALETLENMAMSDATEKSIIDTLRGIYDAKRAETTAAITAAVKRVYEENPPVITKEYVMLAKEIIEIAEKSSLEWMIESIPSDRWREAKDEVIRILTMAGETGLPTSKLEEKLRKYKLGNQYHVMIQDMITEGEIKQGDPAPNGGFRLFIAVEE